jgi:acetyltransferase-like isoleucine patch superfamily enzyme
VLGELAPHTVYGGIPAKVIRQIDGENPGLV